LIAGSSSTTGTFGSEAAALCGLLVSTDFRCPLSPGFTPAATGAVCSGDVSVAGRVECELGNEGFGLTSPASAAPPDSARHNQPRNHHHSHNVPIVWLSVC